MYVSPPGSSADSAGAVIGEAADVLAMAPQTNIGSSTPISLGGEDISKDLRRKVINDAAAYIRELAVEHGRNGDAAARMVTQARTSAPARAKQLNVIDVVAPTLPALLNEIDGTKTVPKGLVLHTAGASVETVEMSFWKRALDLLIDPNIVALMLSHRPARHRRRALEPRADLPRHGRRDLAHRRPLRPPGAAGRRPRACC